MAAFCGYVYRGLYFTTIREYFKLMKRINQPPIGIIVTWGKDMIRANGGLLKFIRHFEECCQDEDSGTWLHKCKNGPKEDIAFVYVIVCNRVAYKLFFGGHQTGETTVYKWDNSARLISWPRLVLAGPFEKAPRKIPMRGFQGFRYVYEPLW